MSSHLLHKESQMSPLSQLTDFHQDHSGLVLRQSVVEADFLFVAQLASVVTLG